MSSFTENDEWKLRPVPELTRLAAPIAVSMLSMSVTTVADALFVGRLGAPALAAVGLGGMAAFTLCCFGLGVVRSVKVVTSHAVGGGNPKLVRRMVAAGVVTALALGALSIALADLVRRVLPSLAHGAEAGSRAAEYLSIRAWGFPAFLVANALREARFADGRGPSAMWTSLAQNGVHVLLDAAFVWGLGAGVAGAAWANVVASALGVALLLHSELPLGLPLHRVRLTDLRELWRVGLPLGAQMLLEVGSFATLVAILARVSDVDLAAHQIALQVIHVSFLPAFALGEGASVLVGRAVGADDDDVVPRVARAALGVAVGYTALCGGLFAVFARDIAELFTPDVAVREVAVRVLWVAAGFQVLDGMNIVARCVLRGAGDVRVPAVLAVCIAWGSTPPLAWLLGARLGWGAVGAWGGLFAEIAVGAGVLWWRFWRGSWRHHARAARERLVSEPHVGATEGTPVPAE